MCVYMSVNMCICVYIQVYMCVCVDIYVGDGLYIVTATGHGRIIMPGSKNYYVDRKWGQVIGESSTPSNSGRSSREGAKGLDPDKEKTLVEAWRAFYCQKETKPQKSVSSFAKEEKGRLFTGSSERGNSSHSMAYRSRWLRWVRTWGST